MRYISRFKNSIRASSIYSLAFVLTFALAAGLTTYEEAAAQTPIKLSADADTEGNQTDITELGNAQGVQVTATLDGATNPVDNDIVVTLTVAPEDEDRYAVTGTMEITIRGGDTSGNTNLTFTPVVDGVFHRDLTITISGKTDPARYIESTAVTLLDFDQDVTLSFDEYDGTSGSATLVTSTIRSEMDAEDQEQEVVVHVRAMEAPRSAMDVPITVSRNRSRYSVTGDMTIEITAGDFLGKTTLKITPVDNDRYDADETITVSVGGGLEARPIKITLRDMDETKPVIKIEASPKTVNEDGGDTQIVNVTATLVGDAVQTATKVTLAVTSDNDRFSVSGTKSITISAGRTSNSTNLGFSPVKDAIFNDDLPIVITGSSDYDPVPPLPKASATVTLRDDDQEVTLSVSPSSVTEKEGDAAQKVTITATLPSSTPKEFMIPLDVRMDTDRGSVDQDMPVITIDAGDTSGEVEITITPTDNVRFNKEEDIMVSVSTDAARDNNSLAARPIAIKLTDNESKPKLEIALDVDSVNEADGNGQSVVVMATLKGAAPASGDDAVVMLTVTPEDMTRYEVTADPDFTIPIDGGGEEDSNGNKTLMFNVTDDGIFKQDLVLTITAKADGYDTVTKTVTVRDDDQDVTLSFAEYDGTDAATLVTTANVAEMEGDEEAQERVVWARVMEAPRSAMDVPITVSRNRSRYSVTGDMTIEVSAGDFLGKTTLKFTPVENDRFDKPEDIVVSVGGGLNARTVKIVLSDDDEDEPVLKIEASPKVVNEDGGDTQVVNVTATLDGDPVQTATTVTLKVPEEESRYSVSGTMEITIAAGRTSNSTNLAFVPVKDGIFNQDLDIVVTASSDPSYDPVSPLIASATITLRDDDQEVTLSVSPSSVTETEEADDAAQKVTITAMLPSSTPKDLMIPLQVDDSSPRVNVDVNMPVITIDAGDTSGEVEITITTLNNDLFDDDEDIMVSVTEDGNLAARPVDIKLTDDESKPKLELALSGTEVLESAGGGNQSIIATVTLKGAGLPEGTDTDVTIEVTPADEDMTRYSVTGNDTPIEIRGGSANSSQARTLDFNVMDDGKFFQDMVLTVTAKAVGFDDASKTVTVRDDDQDVTLSFAEYDPQDPQTLVTTANVAEMEGEEEAQERVVWVRVMEAPRSSMDVPITVSRNSSRYSVTGDMTIEVTAGEFFGKTTLKITPVENNRYDKPEDIFVSVGGGLNARTVKIVLSDMDEDEPVLKIEASPKVVNEDGGDTQVVNVTATLDGDPVQTATTVTLEIKPEKADRYAVTGTMEITIAAGRTSNSTNLAFVPVKDGIFNQDLDIVVTASSDPSYDPVSPLIASATITLRDDDQEVTLSVSPSSVTEIEDADDAAQKVTITATIAEAPARDFSVPLIVDDSSPRVNVDVNMPVITIDAGDTSGEVEITITPVNNNVFDDEENIMVSVTEDGNLAARPVDIKLTDDESKPKLELALSGTEVLESAGGGNQSIIATVTLKGAGLPEGTDTDVTIEVTPADEDMTRYSVTGNDTPIEIRGGSANSSQARTLDFNVMDDGKFFQDMVLTVTAKAVGFDDASKTVTVRDDDQDVTLSFAEYDPQDPQTLVTTANVAEMEGEEEAQERVVWVRVMEAPRSSMDIPISVTRNSSRYSVTGDMTIEVTAGEFLGKTTLKITPVENDLYDEPAKIVVSVGGGLTARTITITLNDMDETKPTLKLAASPGTVSEGGGASQEVVVTATLDGDAVRTATTVTLEVKPEDAADRYSVSGNMEITIAAGSNTGTTDLAFSPVMDGNFYPDLPVTITGSSDPNYDPVDPDPKATATVTITDDDQEINLTASPLYITEDGGTDQKVTITAMVTGTPPKQDKTIPLSVTENTSRYMIGDGSSGAALPEIEIAAGASSGEVDVLFSVVDDEAYNGSIDIDIGIAAASDLTAREIKIRLIDDEETHVTLTASTAEIMEAGGTQAVTVTATLSGKLPGSTTITLAKSGTATKGVDYTVTGDEAITIASGATEGTADLSIRPVDDLMFEDGGETIIVDGSAGSLRVASATIKLVDNNMIPLASFTVDPVEINEGDGATVVMITAILAGTSGEDIEIGLATSGSALIDEDFMITGVDDGPDFVIAAGDTMMSKTVTITPVDDTFYEGDEIINVTGTTMIDMEAYGNAMVADITLVENDPAANISLAVDVTTIAEDGGPVDVTITATATTASVVDIPITLSKPGTAEINVDFTVSSEQEDFIILTGELTATKVVTITPIDDEIYEGDEIIMVNGTIPDSDEGEIVVAGTMITLVDNDPAPMISLAVDMTTIAEDGGPVAVTITAMATAASGIDIPITLSKPGTAEINVDFTVSSEQEDFIILTGELTATKVVTITPIDDEIYEGDEIIMVNGTVPGPEGEVDVEGTMITLVDNDLAPMISLAVDVTTIAEDGGPVAVTITATATTASSVDIPITLSKPGTAEINVDFTVSSEQEDFIILTGELMATKVVTITPIDDDIYEGDEIIMVNGTVPDSNGGETVVEGTMITLVDNDTQPMIISLAVDVTTIAEDGGPVAVTITATATTASSVDIPITLSKPGTAEINVDFTVSSEQEDFIILTGELTATKVVTITPIDDDIYEGDEIIMVNGTVSEGEADVEGTMITLTDDEMAPTVALSVDPTSISEDAGDQEVTVTATASGASTMDVVIELSKSGSAVLGTDYEITAATEGDFTIAAGETTATKMLTLTPTNDNIYEGDEEIVVDGSIGDQDVTSASITLTDDEMAPTVALSVDPTSISEDAGDQEVTVTATASGASSMAVVIELSKSGSAVLGTDFEITAATEGDFTIAAGETTATKMLTLTPTNDNIYEGDEEIVVDGSIEDRDVTSASITLTDDEMVPTVALSVDPTSISEDAGDQEVTVTATASGASSMAVVIELSKSGSAVLGTDFEITAATEGDFTIAAGETTATKMLTLTPTNDNIYEGDEEIVVDGSIEDRDVTSTSITLADDDMAPAVALSTDVIEITEHGTAQDITVTATLSHPSSMDIAVELSKSGSATKGEDYTPTGDANITVSAGDLTGTTILTFSPIDDNLYEGDETIVIGGTAGDVMAEAAMVTLVDDESMPTITLTAMPDMIDEGSGPMVGVVTATASGLSAMDLNITLLPLIDQSTATLIGPDADINVVELASGSIAITIPAEQSSGSLNLTIVPVDDSVYETNEYAVFVGNLLGTVTAPVTITIVDNDAPAFTLSANPISLREDGGSQSVSFDVVLSGIAVPLPTVITLENAGTATQGTDYVPSGNAEIVIAAGDMSAGTQITFAVADDDVYEPSNETIVVSANWDSNEIASVTLTIVDNYPAPAVTSAIPDMVLELGDSRQADLSGSFSGKVLTYSASSSGSEVSAEVSGSSLSITANRKGSATVTVMASNVVGSVTFDIGVTVTAIAAEREVYTDILAAMGRGILSSVSQTIGGRFSVGAAERQVALANRRVDGMAAGMDALIGLTGTQATTKYGITDDSTQRLSRQPVSTRDLMRGSSFYYALDDAPQGGMDSGLSFTIWGAGDWNAFEGAHDPGTSYDGTLTSGYLGVDVSKTASWIAGVAVGRTMGESNYDVTVTDGTLEATLNSVYPYVHWTGPGCCIEVWGIGGFGTGEVEVSDGTSDLSMSMGMIGVRAQLVGAATGGLDLDLIGDAGINKLTTADSESASLSDLEASVQRVRIGLEGSVTSQMGNGMLVTPFAQVAGRYDGGDGATGNGLEVAGGLRIAGGRAGLEARGRFLAMHTGEEVKEHGVSVVAYVRPMGAGGQGLSMSIAPRLGADTDMSGGMWREDRMNDVTRTSRTGAGVKAEIGYGLVSPMISNLLVTPFGTMDMAGEDQRRMRLGARFGSIGDTTSVLSFELAGERIDGNGRTPDHRIGLRGRMSF